MSVAVRDKTNGLYLGRGRGQGRKWVRDIQKADLWDQAGPGRIAAKQAFGWRESREMDKSRFEYVHVVVAPITGP